MGGVKSFIPVMVTIVLTIMYVLMANPIRRFAYPTGNSVRGSATKVHNYYLIPDYNYFYQWGDSQSGLELRMYGIVLQLLRAAGAIHPTTATRPLFVRVLTKLLGHYKHIHRQKYQV